MPQNRNKLLNLLIGNLANAILHRILEKAINNEEVASRYRKEIKTSLEIAKQYREKINPTSRILAEKDANYVRTKILQKVQAELSLRISKGYQNLNMKHTEEYVEQALLELKIKDQQKQARGAFLSFSVLP